MAHDKVIGGTDRPLHHPRFVKEIAPFSTVRVNGGVKALTALLV